MVSIVSLNANGIRSAAKKGFFNWMERHQPDVVCLQETRASESDLDSPLFAPLGYQSFFVEAEKKGYSGVAIYTRHEPKEVIRGVGWDKMDTEGRYLQLDFKDVSVVSLYLPSGTSSEIRQEFKYECLDRFESHLVDLRNQGREIIICGDFNIAHKPIDLKNWKTNQKNSGFLPLERAWLDVIFDKHGWVDAFREINTEAEQYTWWSNRGQAWAKNVGWRIDYHVVTPGLKGVIKRVAIEKEERFSDHAPVTVEYDLEF